MRLKASSGAEPGSSPYRRHKSPKGESPSKYTNALICGSMRATRATQPGRPRLRPVVARHAVLPDHDRLSDMGSPGQEWLRKSRKRNMWSFPGIDVDAEPVHFAIAWVVGRAVQPESVGCRAPHPRHVPDMLLREDRPDVIPRRHKIGR